MWRTAGMLSMRASVQQLSLGVSTARCLHPSLCLARVRLDVHRSDATTLTFQSFFRHSRLFGMLLDKLPVKGNLSHQPFHSFNMNLSLSLAFVALSCNAVMLRLNELKWLQSLVRRWEMQKFFYSSAHWLHCSAFSVCEISAQQSLLMAYFHFRKKSRVEPQWRVSNKSIGHVMGGNAFSFLTHSPDMKLAANKRNEPLMGKWVWQACHSQSRVECTDCREWSETFTLLFLFFETFDDREFVSLSFVYWRCREKWMSGRNERNEWKHLNWILTSRIGLQFACLAWQQGQNIFVESL